MTAAAPTDRRWVFGPLPDLMFGCGLGYLLFIALLPLLPLEPRLLAALGAFATLFIGAPHYGATLLRVYRNAEDRRKYAFFAIYCSAAVWLWFVVGLHQLALGSAMITLYLTWSPWHYTGQNYGLAVMFLRRRGVAFSPATKRVLYASFGLSYALVFLSLHRGGQPLGRSYGAGDFSGTPFYFIHLGIPLALWQVAFGVLGVAYVAVTVWAFARLLRNASFADLLPVAALSLAQALWFGIPNGWVWWRGDDLANDSVSWFFVWAVLGHSIQYLWITTYYAVGREGGRARWGYLWAVLGAGSAVWALPALLFAPSAFGALPYSMGLLLMIAAAVNLQHFILDGAIWKLRDSRVGRVLLAQPSDEALESPREDSRWLRWAGGAAAAFFVAISLFGGLAQFDFGRAMRGQDLRAARAAGDRLEAIGRISPVFYEVDAQLAASSGDLNGALSGYRASLALHPTAGGWLGLGQVEERRGRLGDAERAYAQAIALEPRNAEARHRYGRLLLSLGRPAEASRALQLAARRRPGA